ncbi:MAG: SpoIIE family protein phosphatase [Anaerolineae bacterium]|nr:SpoIIE family protein phosphatase [Anaerolineae bacterium]MDW8072001.1 SpoIIE family protein phosphatase [Anaerolineae bacterium]
MSKLDNHSRRQGHILVVDDSAQERAMLTRLLERMGHTVMSTSNGEEALECLANNEFDLVLLDLVMPDINGVQVLEHIRSDPSREHIPVLVISALDDMESVVRCVELGAEDYLPKPVNETLLRAHVSAALEKKWLRDQERAYLAAIRREMELGRQIQADFMPAELPQVPGWEIATRFLPAGEVSGDFFDVFQLSDTHLSLAIGDVSGKGVGAALFVALIRTLLRAFAELADGSPDHALNAVRLVNRYILRHHQQRTSTFATLFLGVLAVQTGTLQYINAGHVPAVLSRADGSQELLFSSGPMVGVTEALPFEEHSIQLNPGDLLLLYTDGVTEAMNTKFQLFGIERLQEVVRSNSSSPGQLLSLIETHLIMHSGGALFSDDVTMLAIKRL